MDFLNLLNVIVTFVITGVASKWLAEKKGYTGYFWTGFLLNVVGVAYVAGLPDMKQMQQIKELEKALKEHEQHLHERTREMMALEVQKAVQEALAKAAPAREAAPEPPEEIPGNEDKGRAVQPGRYWAEDVLVPGRLLARSDGRAHLTLYARGGSTRFDGDVTTVGAVVTVYGDDQILIDGGSIVFHPTEA